MPEQVDVLVRRADYHVFCFVDGLKKDLQKSLMRCKMVSLWLVQKDKTGKTSRTDGELFLSRFFFCPGVFCASQPQHVLSRGIFIDNRVWITTFTSETATAY
jgi:hypothetical protein